MGYNTAILVYGEEGPHIAAATVRQGYNERIGRDDLTSFRVNDGRGITYPVHLQRFSQLAVQVYRGIDFAASQTTQTEDFAVIGRLSLYFNSTSKYNKNDETSSQLPVWDFLSCFF